MCTISLNVKSTQNKKGRITLKDFVFMRTPFDIPAVLHGLKGGMLSTFLSNDASDSVKVRLADELNDETSFLNFRGLEC